MNDNEFIDYVRKSGNYFDYELLIPELKAVANRLQIMTFASPEDAYLNTDELCKEYEEIYKDHCFIHCLH